MRIIGSVRLIACNSHIAEVAETRRETDRSQLPHPRLPLSAQTTLNLALE